MSGNVSPLYIEEVVTASINQQHKDEKVLILCNKCLFNIFLVNAFNSLVNHIDWILYNEDFRWKTTNNYKS